jgi:hypothetical protein
MMDYSLIEYIRDSSLFHSNSIFLSRRRRSYEMNWTLSNLQFTLKSTWGCIFQHQSSNDVVQLINALLHVHGLKKYQRRIPIVSVYTYLFLYEIDPYAIERVVLRWQMQEWKQSIILSCWIITQYLVQIIGMNHWYPLKLQAISTWYMYIHTFTEFSLAVFSSRASK